LNSLDSKLVPAKELRNPRVCGTEEEEKERKKTRDEERIADGE
jgi:hypothetical protein